VRIRIYVIGTAGRNLLKNTSYVPQGEISFEEIAGRARHSALLLGLPRMTAKMGFGIAGQTRNDRAI